MVAVLVVAWMLGVAISGSRIPGISPQVRDSQVLVAVNDVMPVQAQQALRSFDDVVGSSFFPRYLEPFAPERIVSVAPADPRVLRDPDIRDAGPACSRSAAPTAAAAASRAPASSTRPTG